MLSGMYVITLQMLSMGAEMYKTSEYGLLLVVLGAPRPLQYNHGAA